MISSVPYYLLLLVLWFGCKTKDKTNTDPDNTPTVELVEAAVTDVAVSGKEGAYTFSVTLKTSDTGCEQYANWWEVLSEDGQLLHRRILAHSHPNEQPFTRSGGPVPVKSTRRVYIRGHMNNTGYGTKVYHGSVAAGFTADTLEADFAADLEQQAPQPGKCAF